MIGDTISNLKTHTANGVKIEPGLRVWTNDLGHDILSW
jgi:hypothetical protein